MQRGRFGSKLQEVLQHRCVTHLYFFSFIGLGKAVPLLKGFFMEPVKFTATISSLSEIKIPDYIREKIRLNQDVQVLLLPAGERLYEDWKDDEWNQLSIVNEDGE
jgi:hypothetical protein